MAEESYQLAVYPRYPLWRDKAPRGYSSPLFYRLFELWTDYERNILPGPGARSAQNPRLLRAFHALAEARSRAERYLKEHPPS